MIKMINANVYTVTTSDGVTHFLSKDDAKSDAEEKCLGGQCAELKHAIRFVVMLENNDCYLLGEKVNTESPNTALRKQALAKLTPEEIKALGIKE